LLIAAPISLVLLAARLWSGGEATGEPRKFSTEIFGAFDTVITFTAFAADEAEFERYVDIARDEMTRLHRLFDIYNGYEGLVNMRSINDGAGGEPQAADPAIIDLLEMGKAAYRETDGAVNIALGPVLSIWHERRERAHNEETSAPLLDELREAAVHISPDDIVTDAARSTVFLRHADMRLDVGAIGKGYAAGRTAAMLKAAGLRSGVLNAGGSVSAIGSPLDGRDAWNIGVHSPSGADLSELVDVLAVADTTVVTSGNDQRYFVADGVRYHHIIDPATLFPAARAASVTVLHPDSAVADILSTGAFIMPREKALDLVKRHGAEAIWITSDGEAFMTDGYRKVSKIGDGAPAPKEDKP
jgi:thiamine biosynthesis lipoprotein